MLEPLRFPQHIQTGSVCKHGLFAVPPTILWRPVLVQDRACGRIQNNAYRALVSNGALESRVLTLTARVHWRPKLGFCNDPNTEVGAVKSSPNIPPQPIASFRDFYEDHFDYVVRLFLRKGCEKEQAKDLTQESFVCAYKARDDFRGDAKPRTWLTQIALNVFKNHLRSRSTNRSAHKAVPLDTAPPQAAEDPSPLDQIIEKENAQRLEQALMALPQRMQRCMRLRLEQGRKYKDIAVLMQVSMQTVKTTIHDGRQRLTDWLASQPDNPS